MVETMSNHSIDLSVYTRNIRGLEKGTANICKSQNNNKPIKIDFSLQIQI